ncbi:putative transmembrane protein [Toxoplasma gondii VEG]|uniref:Transmembrane protein n=3 Tax=Toxoplasma gondii TaxID=5811 RepID=V4ZT70_TOXGV|nr:putative transmembrane protein [Toxoplasma gondii VEG]
MAIVRLNSQCHLATDFAGCRMLSWTPKFVSNRRFRGITPCTVVVCMLLLLSPEAPVAFRWPFHHPAHPQWTNSGVPQFLFASAAEQTQTPEHGTESETDGVDTQAQSEQPPAIRRRTRSLGSSLRQRSVAAKRMMLARFFLAAIPIIALGYGCYKFFEEEGETAGKGKNTFRGGT